LKYTERAGRLIEATGLSLRLFFYVTDDGPATIAGNGTFASSGDGFRRQPRLSFLKERVLYGYSP